jgi:hypothetical protein
MIRLLCHFRRRMWWHYLPCNQRHLRLLLLLLLLRVAERKRSEDHHLEKHIWSLGIQYMILLQHGVAQPTPHEDAQLSTKNCAKRMPSHYCTKTVRNPTWIAGLW